MQSYLKYLLLLPFWAISCQIIYYNHSLKNEQRQKGCLILGILFSTIGIVSLVSRDVALVMNGFVQIMLGLRLISCGLDRVDKKVFTDLYKNE